VECGVVISPPGTDSIVVQWCNNPGLYTIQVVEFNLNGCPGDTITARVFVRKGIDVYITGPPEICRGELLVLQAHGADKYIWNTGDIGSTLILRADTRTDFSVKGYDAGSCSPDSASFKVKIWEKPVADFSFNSGRINQNEDVNFSFTGSNARQLEWIFDNDTSTRTGGPNITYRFSDSGRHEVKLIAYNTQGCTDTIIYKVMVGGSSTIFMPNAFTPNGDGLNDVLMPATYGIRALDIIIYNRWGQTVKELHGVNATWDGRDSNGKKLESGVYIYSLKAQGEDSQWHYLKGDLTILH
jgi:gliding motility-associated-like protein